MVKNKIIHSADTISGAPRLNGKRIDVGHVIWGISDYFDGNIRSYQESFDVTENEIKHAILYCKEQVCEIEKVKSSCNLCTKTFSNIDFSSEEKFDIWTIADDQFQKMKIELNLPNDYESLINNDK